MQADSPNQSPASRIDSWTEAENAFFRHLCEATGHIPGTNAFIGAFEIAGIANAFYLNSEAVSNAPEVFLAPRCSGFVVPYEATGYFLDRADVQRWAMRAVDAFPVRGLGNAQVVQLTNVGAIRQQAVTFASEGDRAVAAWSLELSFNLVVNRI